MALAGLLATVLAPVTPEPSVAAPVRGMTTATLSPWIPTLPFELQVKPPTPVLILLPKPVLFTAQSVFLVLDQPQVIAVELVRSQFTTAPGFRALPTNPLRIAPQLRVEAISLPWSLRTIEARAILAALEISDVRDAMRIMELRRKLYNDAEELFLSGALPPDLAFLEAIR